MSSSPLMHCISRKWLFAECFDQTIYFSPRLVQKSAPEVTWFAANRLIESLAGRFRKRTVSLPAHSNPACEGIAALLPWSDVCSLNPWDEFTSFIFSHYANPFASISTRKSQINSFCFGLITAYKFSHFLKYTAASLCRSTGHLKCWFYSLTALIWNPSTVCRSAFTRCWIIHLSLSLCTQSFRSLWLHTPLSQWRMKALHQEQNQWAAALNPSLKLCFS